MNESATFSFVFLYLKKCILGKPGVLQTFPQFEDLERKTSIFERQLALHTRSPSAIGRVEARVGQPLGLTFSSGKAIMPTNSLASAPCE